MESCENAQRLLKTGIYLEKKIKSGTEVTKALHAYRALELLMSLQSTRLC